MSEIEWQKPKSKFLKGFFLAVAVAWSVIAATCMVALILTWEKATTIESLFFVVEFILATVASRLAYLESKKW